jgi:DNA-binding NarL/FixJ family response regulator
MILQKMKLMIVDDHPGTRGMIRKFLGCIPGITFCECVSGEEAVRLARGFKPDWVTMDIHMPGLNGFESTKALLLEHPSLRVLIVTADSQPHFPKMSRDAGAVGLLAKENILGLRVILEREMRNEDGFPSSDADLP